MGKVISYFFNQLRNGLETDNLTTVLVIRFEIFCIPCEHEAATTWNFKIATLDLFRQELAIGVMWSWRCRFGRPQYTPFQGFLQRTRKHPASTAGQPMQDSGATLDTRGGGIREIQID